MEKTMKVVAWVEIVLGALAIVSSAEGSGLNSFIGGALFMGAGIIALNYISNIKKQ